jgi:predicted DNA-binding antitoxin AbrB/MazE fold protein
MTPMVKAVYEGGILRPLEPLDLSEHESVDVLLLTDERAKVAAAQRVALEGLIGAAGSEATDISSRHNAYLYTRRQ